MRQLLHLGPLPQSPGKVLKATPSSPLSVLAVFKEECPVLGSIVHSIVHSIVPARCFRDGSGAGPTLLFVLWHIMKSNTQQHRRHLPCGGSWSLMYYRSDAVSVRFKD